VLLQRGKLGDVNIVAFYHPLVADWELMEKDAEGYRMRIRSAICHWRSENPVNSASLKTGYGAAIFSSPT
jgi:hypothetical protein